MARVKRGVPAHRRHKAILDRAKGFRLSKKLLFRPATAAVLREPVLVLLEGPRVLAEAKAAGLAFDLIAVREGDKLPFHTDARVTLTPAAFRAATQTVTPQGAIAIARVHEASPGEAIDAARAAGWPLVVLDGVQDPGNVGAICRTAAA